MLLKLNNIQVVYMQQWLQLDEYLFENQLNLLKKEDLGKILLLLYNAVSVHMNIKIQLNLMLGSEQFKVI